MSLEAARFLESIVLKKIDESKNSYTRGINEKVKIILRNKCIPTLIPRAVPKFLNFRHFTAKSMKRSKTVTLFVTEVKWRIVAIVHVEMALKN
jgi:hypothetical protein